MGLRISAPPVIALPEMFPFERYAAADGEVPDDVGIVWNICPIRATSPLRLDAQKL